MHTQRTQKEEIPTEVRNSCPSSRSSSPRASRSPSPRTPEKARLLHGPSSPQKRRDSIVPQPPPGSPGCDDVCMPPPPPESPLSNQLRSGSIEEIDVEAMNSDGHDRHTQQSEGMEQSLAEATKDGQAK